MRIRTPFHTADDGWQSALEWNPGEERQSVDEFIGEVDYELPPPPNPREVIEASDGPGIESQPDRLDLDGPAAKMLDRPGLDAFQSGRLLKRHDFTHGVPALPPWARGDMDALLLGRGRCLVLL